MLYANASVPTCQTASRARHKIMVKARAKKKEKNYFGNLKTGSKASPNYSAGKPAIYPFKRAIDLNAAANRKSGSHEVAARRGTTNGKTQATISDNEAPDGSGTSTVTSSTQNSVPPIVPRRMGLPSRTQATEFWRKSRPKEGSGPR